LDDDAGIQSTINHFLERRVKWSVVITMGARGCYCKNSDHQEGWIRPDVWAQDVVDATGAGDTFVCAFSVACADGNGIGVYMNFATRGLDQCSEDGGPGTDPMEGRGAVEEEIWARAKV